MVKVDLKLMRFLALAVFSLALSSQSFGQRTPRDTTITIGAIRWDAWLGENDNVGKQLNRSLGPDKWGYRRPFYTQVLGPNSVDINMNSQEVADREIEYAAYAQLDYFAFLMYAEHSSLSDGLKKYLTSSKKHLVNFCVVMSDRQDQGETIAETVERILGYIEEPTYQMVMDSRPLVFSFRLGDDKPQFAATLKVECEQKGLSEPYIVELSSDNTMPNSPEYDAISRYWFGGNSFGGLESGAPYSALMDAAQENWQLRADSGARQVPLVSLGTDGRPRIENPPSWTGDPSFYEKYFQTAEPYEIATHLGEAFDFVSSNPTSAEAKTILMYAWNENDEGGWLMPTLKSNGDIDTSRIDAMRSFMLGEEVLPTVLSTINYTDGDTHISVYPNPANDNLEIVCGGVFSIDIYDLNGRLKSRIEKAENRVSLSMSFLPKGMYVLNISNNNLWVNRMIVKN